MSRAPRLRRWLAHPINGRQTLFAIDLFAATLSPTTQMTFSQDLEYKPRMYVKEKTCSLASKCSSSSRVAKTNSLASYPFWFWGGNEANTPSKCLLPVVQPLNNKQNLDGNRLVIFVSTLSIRANRFFMRVLKEKASCLTWFRATRFSIVENSNMPFVRNVWILILLFRTTRN